MVIVIVCVHACVCVCVCMCEFVCMCVCLHVVCPSVACTLLLSVFPLKAILPCFNFPEMPPHISAVGLKVEAAIGHSSVPLIFELLEPNAMLRSVTKDSRCNL